MNIPPLSLGHWKFSVKSAVLINPKRTWNRPINHDLYITYTYMYIRKIYTCRYMYIVYTCIYVCMYMYVCVYVQCVYMYVPAARLFSDNILVTFLTIRLCKYSTMKHDNYNTFNACTYM